MSLFYFRDIAEYKAFLKKKLGLKKIELSLPMPEEENLVVFIPHENQDFNTCSYAAQCICDERNPLYDPKAGLDEQWNFFINLSTHEMLQYLFAHNMLPDLRFGCPDKLAAESHQIVVENWEFLERTLKHTEYGDKMQRLNRLLINIDYVITQ